MAEGQRFSITWHNGGDGARLGQPDPAFPHGVDVDISEKPAPSCTARLDCPAPRCGAWLIECQECGATVAVSAAGRADDPRSLTMGCAALGTGSTFSRREPAPEPAPKPAATYSKPVKGQRALF